MLITLKGTTIVSESGLFTVPNAAGWSLINEWLTETLVSPTLKGTLVSETR